MINMDINSGHPLRRPFSKVEYYTTEGISHLPGVKSS